MLDLRRLATLADALGYGGLVDLLIHASTVAAQLEASIGGPSPEGGGSNGRSR